MLRRSKVDDDENGPRILVANDDEAGCELVARILEANGFSAVRSHAHNDALLALNKASQPVRGVIIDFTSGATSSNLKLLDSIRHGDEANRECGVLVLAASSTNRLFAFQSGADAFMVRPFHANEMVAQLRDLLARSEDERISYRNTQLREAQSA